MPMRLIKAIVVAGAPPSTEPLPPTREATLAGLGQGTRIVSGELVEPGVLGLAATTDPSKRPADAGLHARWTGGTRIARPIHGPRPSARRRAAPASQFAPGEWVEPGVLGLAAATDPSKRPADAGPYARWTGGTRMARPIHGPRPSARRRAAPASQFAPGELVEPGVLGLAATTDPSKKPADAGLFDGLAGGPGFEPGLTESESVVLPLDDPPR